MSLIRWIVASAGTGKTYRIAELIDQLIHSNVEPSSILCLSFTKHAAAEMHQRYIARTNGLLASTAPRFETIHSFAQSFINNTCKVMTDNMIDDIIREAIEVVGSQEQWREIFFDIMQEYSSSIIADIKYILSNNINIYTSTLNKYLIKSMSNFKFEVKLSNQAIEALKASGLTSTLNKILTNNFDVYLDSLITKDLRINKRYLPESFLQNPLYAKEALEIRDALNKIVDEINEFANSAHIKKSITVNLLIREICLEYHNIKAAQNLVDFNDMIKLATQALGTSSEKLLNIRHVFLDEAQDTSELQWKFIYNVVSEILQVQSASFTVVGDKKQIVYEFNGASKSVYEQMKIKLKNVVRNLDGEWQEYDLNQSYRAPQVLLDFVDTVMQTTKYPSQHHSARSACGYVKIWLPAKTEKEAPTIERGWRIPKAQELPEWVQLCIAELKNLLTSNRLLNEDRPVTPSDIMILIPRRCINTFLLVEEIKKHNIPIAESPFSINSDATIQELIAIAEIVLDVSNDLLLAGILKGPYFQWTNEQVEHVAIDREDTLWNHMCTLEDEYVKHAVSTIQEWLEFPRDLLTFYSNVLFHTEYGKTISLKCRNEMLLFWEKVVQNASLSMSEFILLMKNTNDPFRSYQDGVIISTVHGAKGREANIVFLCNAYTSNPRNLSLQIMHDNILLLKGNYAVYKNAKIKSLIDQENESDRLMYVALTRAKEQLYIFPPLSSDNINPKSWYAKIVRHSHLFTPAGDDVHELGVRPPAGHLTKYHKYH